MHATSNVGVAADVESKGNAKGRAREVTTMRGTLLLMGIFALGFVEGCAQSRPLAELPAARPLGGDIPTFAPSRSPEDPRPAKIEPRGDLSLTKSLALALLHNPQLEAYGWQLRGSEAAILQSRLRPNPVVGLKVENFGGTAPLDSLEGSMTTLRISQAIELGGKRMRRTRLAEKEHLRSAWDYERERLRVIGEVGRRFVHVLADQEELKLAQQAAKLATDLYDIVKDRTDQGVSAGVELDKALVQVSVRRIEVEQQVQQLRASKQRLAATWGSGSVRFGDCVGEWTEVHDLPAQEELLAQVEENPDIARWSAEIALREAAVDLSRARAIPNLTVGGGLRRFNATDENAYVFELGLPLPLTDRNQGRRRQARYELEKAKALKRDAETAVHSRLGELYYGLSAHHHAVTTLRDQTLPAARSAFDTAHKAYREGVTDYINVLDAERTLIDTQYQHVASLSEYHQTVIALESLLGVSLDPE